MKKKELKEAAFQDVKAELDGLMAEVERHIKILRDLSTQEEEASKVVKTYPEKIDELKDKLKSAEQLL